MSNRQDAVTWNGNIHIAPAGGVATLPVIVGGNVSTGASAWRTVTPASDTLEVVKITKDNLVAVAKSLVCKDGPSVSIQSTSFKYGTVDFHVGDYLVREYDFVIEFDVVRLATQAERKRYNLR